jgi:hypothetical protein
MPLFFLIEAMSDLTRLGHVPVPEGAAVLGAVVSRLHFVGERANCHRDLISGSAGKLIY